MAVTQLLALVVVVGLAGAAIAALARVTPIWPASWLGKKPLACVACMAGHGSWMALALAILAGVALPVLRGPEDGLVLIARVGLVWLGATGVAVLILGQSGLFMAPLSLGDLSSPEKE